MKKDKKPKFTKTAAAKMFGVSLYRLNQLIKAGVLSDKPTPEAVTRAIKKYSDARAAYSEDIVRAFEAGHSLHYCAKLISDAIETYDLLIPKNETPEQFVWGVIYRHEMRKKVKE